MSARLDAIKQVESNGYATLMNLSVPYLPPLFEYAIGLIDQDLGD